MGEKMASVAAASSDTVAENGRRRQVMAAIRPVRLVDQVIEASIHAAAEGRILPGDRLVESDIASALQGAGCRCGRRCGCWKAKASSSTPPTGACV